MAGPSPEQLRQMVSDMYPGDGWKARVARMPDAQVFAIYMGKLEGAKEPAKPKMAERVTSAPIYTQETLF